MGKQTPGKSPAHKDASNYSESYLKTLLWIVDDLKIRPSEFRILVHIIRQTIGYGKKSDGISTSQFAAATGLSNSTVIEAVKGLKKQGLIRVVRQKKKNGGFTYSRYSLKLKNPYLKIGEALIGKSDIQNIKSLRENINDDGDDAVLPPDCNIHLAMPENERMRWMSKYAEKVSLAARNPQAYKRKIMRQLERGEPSTMKALESFVLDEVEADFFGRLPIQLDDERIESVYTYRKSKGFNPVWKILVESRDGDGRLIRSYPAPHLLELEIEEGRLLAKRIIYREEEVE